MSRLSQPPRSSSAAGRPQWYRVGRGWIPGPTNASTSRSRTARPALFTWLSFVRARARLPSDESGYIISTPAAPRQPSRMGSGRRSRSCRTLRFLTLRDGNAYISQKFGPVVAGNGGAWMAVTIKDVAKAARVSVATVSRALNDSGNVTEETRRHVGAVAEKLGYVPHEAARSLSSRSRRTRCIGAVLPDLHGEFFSELIRGIDRA